MNAKLIKRESVTGNSMSFWFEPEKRLRHIAGQFVEVYVPHNSPDERGEKRWFTISSSPEQAAFSITTRIFEKPSTFKHALNSLRVGDSVTVSEAMGDFVLPLSKDLPLTFVAGGIGCTPFHSMVSWLSDVNETRNIRIVLAAENPENLLWLETFKQIDPNIVLTVTKPDSAWKHNVGRLTPQLIIQSCLPESLIYISGPEKMVEDLIKGLLADGLPKDSLIGDYFPGYSI